MSIEQIKRCGRFIGRKELLMHMNGLRLTQRQIIKAKCFECMGGYADGPRDCHIPDCPLYGLMPYRTRIDSLPVAGMLEGDTEKQNPGKAQSTTPEKEQSKTTDSQI